LRQTYSLRPERQALGIIGASAGGYGAMSLAIQHRDMIGAVAALAGPLNLRYTNIDGDYREDFDPATYRWNTEYNPDEVVGRFYWGLKRTRAQKFMQPVFGQGSAVVGRVMRSNPADLIFSTNLQPGELAIYVDYGGRDNWNFDAQGESFVWLARQRGIAVTVGTDPRARHNLQYFHASSRRAFDWMGHHLLPPEPRSVSN
jgi:S-formylglutathione hydrolase FrmB